MVTEVVSIWKRFKDSPSQVFGSLAKTLLVKQLRATAEDFGEVGRKCFGDAIDNSLGPDDRAEGYDRWFDEPGKGLKAALAAVIEGKWSELKSVSGAQKVFSLLTNFTLLGKVEATFAPYRLPFPAEIDGNKCNLKNCLIEGNLAGFTSDKLTVLRIGLDSSVQ